MTFHPDIKLQVEKQLDLAFWAIKRWKLEPDPHYLTIVHDALTELSRLGFHTLVLKKDMSLITIRADVWAAMKKYKEVADGLGISTSQYSGNGAGDSIPTDQTDQRAFGVQTPGALGEAKSRVQGAR